MESRKRTTSTAHKWTNFEKHTLLCLLAKGIHLAERGKRGDEPGIMRRNAYLNVATELNKAVNGTSDYAKDIDKREVTKMIDKMMVEQKGVFGKGGFMERSTRGRITRGLKRMSEREPSFNYDGSLSEWDQWRKASEAEKRCTAAGGAPEAGGGAVQPIEVDDRGYAPPPAAQKSQQLTTADTRYQADAVTINRSAPVSNSSIARATAVSNSNNDSFDRLPACLRGNSRYSWANSAGSINNSQYSYPDKNKGSSKAVSYRPSSSSSPYRGPPSYQASDRNGDMVDSYHPPVNVTRPIESCLSHRAPSELPPPPVQPFRQSSYYSPSSQLQYAAQNEQFDQSEDGIASTPSFAYDYSSSPNKNPDYSSTTHSTNNLYEDTGLVRSIEAEISQRKSSEYKKPGSLKCQPVLNDSQVTSDLATNHTKCALPSAPEIRVGGSEHMDSGHGPVGKGTSKEDLPFNRLERVRGNSEPDIEMSDSRY